jgi:hypothetical protein
VWRECGSGTSGRPFGREVSRIVEEANGTSKMMPKRNTRCQSATTFGHFWPTKLQNPCRVRGKSPCGSIEINLACDLRRMGLLRGRIATTLD